jgi:hypothetical protein
MKPTTYSHGKNPSRDFFRVIARLFFSEIVYLFSEQRKPVVVGTGSLFPKEKDYLPPEEQLSLDL